MSRNKSNYFSHDSNARNSDKLIRLRMKHKAAGYGVYFMILERLREEPDYMSVKDYNMIAFDLREDASLIKSVVEDFGLFVFTEDGKYFYSESFNKRMAVKDEIREKRSEAGRAAMSKKWGTDSDSDTSNSKLRSQRLKLAREKGTHTRKEWDEMKNFFGECVICGSKENIVKDHIIPLYQGGSDEITNLQPLCSSCNSRKGADNNDYRKEWCESKGIEMPNKWLTKDNETPNKERKEKESKEEKEKPTIVGKKKESATADIQTRKNEFYDSLVPFVEKYGKETIREFFDYWSEMNKTQTKMRFEQEKTWELPKRLAYWARNDKNFNKQSKQSNDNGRINWKSQLAKN